MKGYLHALCPVRFYNAAAWVGWTILGTERVEHTAGVAAYGASRTERTLSTGEGYDAYHLVKPRPYGGGA